MLITYRDQSPTVHETAWIGAGAKLIGDVTVAQEATIWYNTVLRADLAAITIGKRTNIQDSCIGHVNSGQPLVIGDDVSVGHGAIVHGCTIGQGTLIGMGAIVLNGAEIGEYALVGAGAVVTENKRIPPRTLVLGTPARVVRELTDDDLERMRCNAADYVERGREQRSRTYRLESDTK